MTSLQNTTNSSSNLLPSVFTVPEPWTLCTFSYSALDLMTLPFWSPKRMRISEVGSPWRLLIPKGWFILRCKHHIHSPHSIQPVRCLHRPFHLCCLFRRTCHMNPCQWASHFAPYKHHHPIVAPVGSRGRTTFPFFLLMVSRFSEPNLSIFECSHNLLRWLDPALVAYSLTDGTPPPLPYISCCFFVSPYLVWILAVKFELILFFLSILGFCLLFRSHGGHIGSHLHLPYCRLFVHPEIWYKQWVFCRLFLGWSL